MDNKEIADNIKQLIREVKNLPGEVMTDGEALDYMFDRLEQIHTNSRPDVDVLIGARFLAPLITKVVNGTAFNYEDDTNIRGFLYKYEGYEVDTESLGSTMGKLGYCDVSRSTTESFRVQVKLKYKG